MSDTPDLASCATDILLPISPFHAVNYHFGMLLGVEDFQTEQAYHRGKARLHNAWLHREGVVWGLGVTLDIERAEVRVGRGLALDPAGRELHLEEDACLSIPAWLDALSEEERATLACADENGSGFCAHVLIRHRACLTRPVPALMEVCEGSGRDTAYSRVFETLELRLMPGPAPEPPVPPYHRVRLMLGLEPAREPLAEGEGSEAEREAAVAAAEEDAGIVARRDALLAEPREDRLAGALALLRECAAWDTAELAPASTVDGDDRLLFPGTDDAGIVLADLEGLTLSTGSGDAHLDAGSVDYGARPSHLASRTIQELAAAVFFCCSEPAPDSGDGPRAFSDSVVFRTRWVLFRVDADLNPGSVTPEAFEVSDFDEADGWTTHGVARAYFGAASVGRRRGTVLLTLENDEPLPRQATLYRVVARGTGSAPLLGVDLRPLAGALGGPPAPAGCDFVHQQTDRRGPLRPSPGDDPSPDGGTDTIHRPERS